MIYDIFFFLMHFAISQKISSSNFKFHYYNYNKFKIMVQLCVITKIEYKEIYNVVVSLRYAIYFNKVANIYFINFVIKQI